MLNFIAIVYMISAQTVIEKSTFDIKFDIKFDLAIKKVKANTDSPFVQTW